MLSAKYVPNKWSIMLITALPILLWGAAPPTNAQVTVWYTTGTIDYAPSITVSADTQYMQVNSGGSLTISGGVHNNLTVNGGNVTIVGAYVAHTVVGGAAALSGDGLTLEISNWTGALTYKYDGASEDSLISSVTSLANLTFLVPPEPSGPIEVSIDIKPGTYPNPINQGANGVIPVAIFKTNAFDPATVDPAAVRLNGASVAVRGKSDKTLARLEDVDGDGDLDLMLQIDTESWADLKEDGLVILSGYTYEGQEIRGEDYVVIVPPQE